VADLACGRGRHALAAAEDGARVLALDRDREALTQLHGTARDRRLTLLAVRTDLETCYGIPIRTGACGAILVFRFLYRPLAPAIVQTLQPGGLLLYETFTTGQAALGHGPRNPDFLLQPGELRSLFAGLEVLDYWEGVTTDQRPEAVARLAARRPG
jgi:SAM-dependent methyltransferase